MTAVYKKFLKLNYGFFVEVSILLTYWINSFNDTDVQ